MEDREKRLERQRRYDRKKKSELYSFTLRVPLAFRDENLANILRLFLAIIEEKRAKSFPEKALVQVLAKTAALHCEEADQKALLLSVFNKNNKEAHNG